MGRKRPGLQDYVDGVIAQDRAWVSRAITLVESQRPEDMALADALLSELPRPKVPARRVGISGAPGVGKSTLIEALGVYLCESGQRCAVLAVDPSSSKSQGSILGDKTRMAKLAHRSDALVRPSPSGAALGGVTYRTREAMLVCEAAGYSVIIVETVGVGQSEIWVADLVDSFLLLLLPGAGDELQGIKRGILEVADLIAVNKADGDRRDAATKAALEYKRALSLVYRPSDQGEVKVTTVSGGTGVGIPELWQSLETHRQKLISAGGLAKRRAAQAETWMWRLLMARMRSELERDAAVAACLAELRPLLASGHCSPEAAVQRLLSTWRPSPGESSR